MITQFAKEDQNKKNRIVRETKDRLIAKKLERAQQEGLGVISKAAKIGRYNYKMRKTDF